MKGSLLLILSLLWCGACATGYDSKGFTGGYSETQLAPDVFRVRFAGNGYTSEERAADFALLRAAVLAQQHGFTHFIVLADSDKIDYVGDYRKPSSTVTVRCFAEQPERIHAFDAAFLESSLKGKYHIK